MAKLKIKLYWKLSSIFRSIASFFDKIGLYFFDKVLDQLKKD